MSSAKAVALSIALSLLAAATAQAVNQARPFVPRPADGVPPQRTTYWHDDLESGAPGWTHGDGSYIGEKFHIDSYLAYEDPVQDPDYSWWCGELNPEFSGGAGYGNSWNQWLELPPIELGIVATRQTSWGAIKAMYRESAPPMQLDARKRSVTPMLTFRYRYDCEAGYDYVWVEAESLGEWVVLNHGGWYGRSGGWQDMGADGFSLSGFDDPLRVRFRFYSDGGYSDEDGYYLSDGGAFHVDDISVYDAVTGQVLFSEDCEGGIGQCQPTTNGPAGDYWHLVDSACQAYNGTHAWSVAWPDSASVPPSLVNWLMTPVIDIGVAYSCTLYYACQMFMPGAYGGSWQELSSSDGGDTWTITGWWYGHQCQFVSGYGPCVHFGSVIPIAGPGLPYGTQARAKWVVLTDPSGNGCDVESCPLGYCSAGITLDDVWIKGWEP